MGAHLGRLSASDVRSYPDESGLDKPLDPFDKPLDSARGGEHVEPLRVCDRLGTRPAVADGLSLAGKPPVAHMTEWSLLSKPAVPHENTGGEGNWARWHP